MKRKAIANPKDYTMKMLEPDYGKGHISVIVKKPDGQTEELGTYQLARETPAGIAPEKGKLDFQFDQFGKYEITMNGVVIDRFGNQFQAGGDYEVWVAYPLTFATGIKPGNPLYVGDYYSPAATINPPVPARIEATVTFFPGTRPKHVSQVKYQGTAQKFGYFYPDPSQPPLRFPEPGEYAFDLFATYTDKAGRIYMGHLKNASVVLPAKPNLFIQGIEQYDRRGRDTTMSRLDGSIRGCARIFFPKQSGDNMHFYGNPPFGQEPTALMAASEPTGALQKIYQKTFAPSLVRLSVNKRQEQGLFCRFPGLKDSFCRYFKNNDIAKNLPLLSATSAGYSPHEYPELADLRGYYYIATSRPGFAAYYVIGDSTVFDNYWFSYYFNYANTPGAAKRGDQPGDIYWSVVGGIVADHNSGQGFYGHYSAGGIALLRGDNQVYDRSPFGHPIANINGVDLDIYAGVGPSPGTLYETGAIKGIGSIAVPMVPHNAQILVEKPDGQTHECAGRANDIGNFFCPIGPITFDQSGVYHVFSHFWENGHHGTCAGAKNGWYRVYAVDRSSEFRVLFDPSLLRKVDYRKPFAVSGQVQPSLKTGRAYYSVVAPGILLDEGEIDLENSQFRFFIYPNQLGAQFSNLHDDPDGFVSLPPLSNDHTIGKMLSLLITGNKQQVLSDTIEITVFVEGTDLHDLRQTAGGKFILRGDRAIIPELLRR